MTADDINLSICQTRADLDHSLAARVEVFCKEQGFPEELEQDKWDAVFPDPDVIHIIASQENTVLGSVRVIRLPDQEHDKLGRLVVLKSARQLKLGSKLVLFGEKVMKERWHTTQIKLDSQHQVRQFYEKLGYVMNQERGEYLDDGWPHVEMSKSLI